MRDVLGPDEIVVFVEGPTMIGAMPVVNRCYQSIIEFCTPLDGSYRIKAVLLRRGYQGLNELSTEYPEIKYQVLFDREVTLIGSGQCEDPMWTAVNLKNVNTSRIPRCIDTLKNDKRDLPLRTSIALDNLNSCARSVVNYKWVDPHLPILPDVSTLRSTYFSRKKILLIGDSHIRTFTNYFIRWLCQVCWSHIIINPLILSNILNLYIEFVFYIIYIAQFQGDAFPKYSGSTMNPGICENLTLDFRMIEGCDHSMLPEKGVYDLILFNCGQHPADGRHHWSGAQYKQTILDVIKHVHSKQYNGEFFWVETPAATFRNDNWVVQFTDWRTQSRMKFFNAIANKQMKEVGIGIIPCYSMTQALVDKLCDNAHYPFQGTLDGQVGYVVNHFIKLINGKKYI